MKLTETDLEHVEIDLKGSNKSINDSINDLFGVEAHISAEQLKLLKTNLFRCSECEVWFDVDELAFQRGSNKYCEGCNHSENTIDEEEF